MSSAMSITNSKEDHHDTGPSIINNNHPDTGPSITITVADDDSTVMQALAGGVMQQQDVPNLCTAADIIEIIIEEGPQETTVTPSEATEGVTVEAQSSAVGESQDGKPQRIRIHPKLYKAAVEGNVDFLHSDEFQQLDGPSPLQGVSIGGNTVLHIAAISSAHHLTGRRPFGNYLEFAKEVCNRDRSLLMARNKLMETALCCAVKAGNYEIVSLFISLAEQEKHVEREALLREKNVHGETALHEAARIGDRDIVNELITCEPRLTGIVDARGVSPLYLATMTNRLDIVRLFTREKPLMVSSAGPNGQTALHAAVLEHAGITSELLKWDRSLATNIDDSGSTPLHYAASAGNLATVKILLQFGTSAAYMKDEDGLYPIHVAAMCGSASVIKELIEQIPDSDELLDKDGRNFFQIAIVSGKSDIASSVRRNPTFLRMLNARDSEGNTPVHLAGQRGHYRVVRQLITMKTVYSSIMNRDGLTPVDLCMKHMDTGLRFTMTQGYHLLRCLLWAGALPSPRRVDRLWDDLNIPVVDKKKETDKAENFARNLGIISVLIATVTFAAIFTLPGGYIADDHVNRGTPILSRKYAFKAFLIADMLAFALSMLATVLLIFAGSSIVDLHSRKAYAIYSAALIELATKAAVSAFAIATYAVLSHVNLPMSILVCVFAFGLLAFSNPSSRGVLELALPLLRRLGWTGLFKSHYHHQTRTRIRAEIGQSYLKLVLSNVVVPNLLLYIFIFLFALI